MYEGPSIVDYLKSTGQATDYASRAALAASKGISGYSGSAEQNTNLLNMLRGSGAAPPAQIPGQPQATTQTPQATKVAPQATAQPSSGGGSPPPYAPNVVDQTVEYGGTVWKGQPGGGWTAQSRSGGGSLTGLETSFNQPTINLPELYQSLYASSGIKDIETDLSAKSKAYTDQAAKISNNPYLSEGEMTGRLSKLKDKFNADTANIRDDIAMRKADVETQLNLQTKQFDIQSQQAQQAFQQFNSLLSAGALDNASGEDIASIVRATGISSSMIQSAIGVSKAKNAPKVNTQVIQVDDGKNISAVVINQDTGEVINTQVLSASKPKEPKAQSAGDKKAQEEQSNRDNLISSIKNYNNLSAVVGSFGGVMPIETIYQLYNIYSPFGPAKNSLDEVKEGQITK